MAPSVAARKASPAALSATPIHSRRLTSWPEHAIGEHGDEHEPARDHRLHDGDRRERERADVEAPRRRGDDAADDVDRRAEELDRAVHRPPPLHGRGGDRPAVLEEEPDHGGQRADDREHDAELDGDGQAGKGRRAALLPSAAMPMIRTLTVALALSAALLTLPAARRRQAEAALRLARRLLRHRLPGHAGGRAQHPQRLRLPAPRPREAARLRPQARQLRLRRGDQHVAADARRRLPRPRPRRPRLRGHDADRTRRSASCASTATG